MELNTIYFYFFTATMATSLNLIVGIATACNSKMRKNKSYLLLILQFMLDAAAGSAHMLAAAHRYDENVNNLVEMNTPSHCFLTVATFLLLFFGPGQALMNLVLSVDRVLAVVLPFKYISLGVKYAYRTTMAVCTYLVLRYAAYGVASFTSDQTILLGPGSCKGTYTSVNNSTVSTIGNSLSIVMCVFSVVIYVFVILYYKIYTRRLLSNTNDKYKQKRLKQQGKLNNAVGFAALATFLFYIIPIAAVMFLFPRLEPTELVGTISTYTYLGAISINPTMHPIVYFVRLTDIRVAVINFWTCGKVVPKGSTVGATNVFTTQQNNKSVKINQ